MDYNDLEYREILQQCCGPDWVAYANDSALTKAELAQKQALHRELQDEFNASFSRS